MATQTSYLHLKKPEATDFFSIEDFNDNADLIDTKIHLMETNGVKANGGDADTLDGRTSNQFVKQNLSNLVSVENEGWYRIATNSKAGEVSNILISIEKSYDATPSENTIVVMSSCYSKAKFNKLNHFNYYMNEENQYIKKIRYIGTNCDAPCYVDVYLDIGSYKVNIVPLTTVINGSDWNEVDFEATDEIGGIEYNLSASYLANNLATTEEGFALDARQGKVLYDLINQSGGVWTPTLLSGGDSLNIIYNSSTYTISGSLCYLSLCIWASIVNPNNDIVNISLPFNPTSPRNYGEVGYNHLRIEHPKCIVVPNHMSFINNDLGVDDGHSYAAKGTDFLGGNFVIQASIIYPIK